MPKIDESKLADILNSILTENINRGENLVKNLEKSASEFSKTLDILDKKVTARAVEVQELVKALNNAPKVSKAIKYQTIFICVLTGIVLASLFFSYSLSTVTYNYVKTNNSYKEFIQKYDELENYAILLKNQNEAYKRTLDKTLTQNGREKFREIYMEELEKIKEESK